jgi:hypothetical protein
MACGISELSMQLEMSCRLANQLRRSSDPRGGERQPQARFFWMMAERISRYENNRTL